MLVVQALTTLAVLAVAVRCGVGGITAGNALMLAVAGALLIMIVMPFMRKKRDEVRTESVD